MVAVNGSGLARAVLMLWLVAVGMPRALVAAEFIEFYKLGVSALESEDWEQAAELMREAIALQPKSKARVKKSLYFRRYLPHFYLGKALFELGDCQAALASWREAERQGVVSRFREFEQLTAGRETCRLWLADLEFARSEAQQLLDRAESTAAAALRLLVELSKEGVSAGPLSDRQAAAQADLAAARSRLAAGKAGLAEIEQAAAQAAEAGEQFEAIRRAAETQLETLLARRRQLAIEYDRAVKEARQVLTESEFLAPYPVRVSSRRAVVQQLLEGAVALTPEAGAAERQELQRRLDEAVQDLRFASAPPPVELSRAAEAYLRGDYGEVLSSLADRQFSSGRAASHAHLLNAAALFGLFYTTGAGDQALLEDARQEVRACRAADPSRVPPSALFSPRFIAFFEAQEPVVEQPASGGRDDSR